MNYGLNLPQKGAGGNVGRGTLDMPVASRARVGDSSVLQDGQAPRPPSAPVPYLYAAQDREGEAVRSSKPAGGFASGHWYGEQGAHAAGPSAPHSSVGAQQRAIHQQHLHQGYPSAMPLYVDRPDYARHGSRSALPHSNVTHQVALGSGSVLQVFPPGVAGDMTGLSHSPREAQILTNYPRSLHADADYLADHHVAHPSLHGYLSRPPQAFSDSGLSTSLPTNAANVHSVPQQLQVLLSRGADPGQGLDVLHSHHIAQSHHVAGQGGA